MPKITLNFILEKTYLTNNYTTILKKGEEILWDVKCNK